MTQDELKMVLEFIESINLGSRSASVEQQRQVVAVIKEALAQPEQEQEPVAWQFFEGGKWHNGMEVNDHRKHTEAAGVPVRDLYTTPPQRKP